MREEEGEADRAPRLHRERRDEANTDTAGDLDWQREGDPEVTKPKLWTGREEKPPAKKKATPKALAQPAEPIPDEVEVLDEQTTLGDQ